MNADIRTIALHRDEAHLLRRLLNKELLPEIHVVVTSGMSPLGKTTKLADMCKDFSRLQQMLAWTPADEETGRAFRQLNTEGVIRLRELLLGQMPDEVDSAPAEAGSEVAEIGSRALATLDRALSLHTDTPLMPVRLDNPQARA